MYVAHLALTDFRSYAQVDLELEPGVSVFLGRNGAGKTNLAEAIGYVAMLGSHRVATDAPLVRQGAERAVVRAGLVNEGRTALVELEINPGRANRARLNRAPVSRPREVLGLLRTVLFAPEDLALVKGDPAERRRFLDDLLVSRAPRLAGVRADYDRVLRQRTALLRSAGGRRGGPVRSAGAEVMRTLDVWDDQLARTGAELLAARLELVAALRPLVAATYAQVAAPTPAAAQPCVPAPAEGAAPAQDAGGAGGAGIVYKDSLGGGELVPDRAALVEAIRTAAAAAREAELDRGVSLVGPHRDDLVLRLGELPARGYASHGECWSLALALRLAGFELLRGDGPDPVLILDDVFAELDTGRRDRLARLAAAAEQVVVTAAVAADVPDALAGARFEVAEGKVTRVR